MYFEHIRYKSGAKNNIYLFERENFMLQENNEIALGSILSRTYLTFKRNGSRLMKKYEITPEQFSVLSSLSKTQGISQKELAELTERDQTTVGKIVEKLIKKELVKRTVDPFDRRSVILSISNKGNELYKIMRPEMKFLQEQAFNNISLSEMEVFFITMNKIRDNIS